MFSLVPQLYDFREQLANDFADFHLMILSAQLLDSAEMQKEMSATPFVQADCVGYEPLTHPKQLNGLKI